MWCLELNEGDQEGIKKNAKQWQVKPKAEYRELESIIISNKERSTGVNEFDKVLGGGIVGGTVILLGGDPGIGKTTLLSQVLANISKDFRQKTLYKC